MVDTDLSCPVFIYGALKFVTFGALFRFDKRARFTILSAITLAQSLREQRLHELPEKVCVLSFDDGQDMEPALIHADTSVYAIPRFVLGESWHAPEDLSWLR